MIPDKILIIGITLGLVLTSIIIFVCTTDVNDVQAQPVGRNILYVGGSGPGNYSSIQDAIDDANNGDTVFIYTGTYYERISINQTITIMGGKRNNTIINGTFGGTNGTVVKIYADGVYVENLTVMDSGGGIEYPQAGINIYGSFTSIYNCTITHNWNGIYLSSGSQKNLIFNCTVTYCSFFAIDVDSSDTTISQCNFSYHYYGIQSWGQNNIIEKCIFTMTSGCISAMGLNNTIRHCDLIGGSGMNHFGLAVQYGRVYNCTIDGHPYGVWPGFQTTIEKCQVINNYYGIDADLYTNGSLILDCMISSNTIGINAGSTGNLTIYNCTITENIENGVNLDGCHHINISQSHIFQNNWGINITGGSGNNSIKDCDIFNNENGIHMSETNNTRIENCHIYGHNVTGIRLFHSNNNILSNCQIYSNNVFGVWLNPSSNNKILHCNISYNGNGIMAFGGGNNQILNCIISSNYENGIWLVPPTPLKSLNQENANDVNLSLLGNRAYYDTISYCNIIENNCGIKVDYVNLNTICYCNISDNDLGIHLNDYSDNNTLYLNNFWENTNNVLSSNNSNVWHSPYPLYYIYSGQQHTSFLGNYWDDYSGSDTDGDGIGEVGYQIDNNDYDYYPLCTSWIYYHILDTFSLQLHQGWNLVTVPVVNTWTAETMGENITYCTVVTMFNASTQTFLSHTVGTPHDDFLVKDGVGYFVYCTQDSIFSMPDASITSVTVPILVEWNIVGWHHEYSTTAESLGENISDASVVIMFDAETKIFMTHVVGTPHDNFIVERGMGLFIYTSEASVWHGEG